MNAKIMSLKVISLTGLVIAEILAMSLWFSSSAVLGDMMQNKDVSPLVQALLSSGVQLGFAIGALLYAIAGFADRYDPRKVFAVSAIIAALMNVLLLVLPIGSIGSIFARFATGGLLAGVYPVGMKIAVGWGQKDRGLLVGLLVGALTLGSAAPHLLSYFGGTDWRFAVGGASVLAVLGGLLVLCVRLGPFTAKASTFSLSHLVLAWSDKRIRLAFIGYLGHMWEVYAMWAWLGVALGVSFNAHLGDGIGQLDENAASSLAKLVAFGAIAIGALGCVAAGLLADKIGKAQTTIIAMAGSGASALVAAVIFGGPLWLVISVMMIWGVFIIADSAQFSALVADFAPPERAGALLTLQTALGFGLTTFTVQATPWFASMVTWRGVFVMLALGPAVGIIAMLRLQKIVPETHDLKVNNNE